jgi:predicted nucleic acid-binding protein
MRIYVDSSALVKLAFHETESTALRSYLAGRVAAGDHLVSSSLAWVEVGRAVRSRADIDAPALVAAATDAALEGIDEVILSEQVVSVGRRVGPPTLRSLDAIHVASALVAAADRLVAYDHRLLTAAQELGIETFAPV